jgi:hypothetical protein
MVIKNDKMVRIVKPVACVIISYAVGGVTSFILLF